MMKAKLQKENPGIAIKFYRIERWSYIHHFKVTAQIMYRLLQILFGCTIPPTTEIGENVIIPHSTGIVLHQWSKIGAGTKIYQNVTIGNANGPVIGKNCVIGAGAVILGDIKIGDYARIGANAVVLCDVPEGATAVGVPAGIIEKKVKES